MSQRRTELHKEVIDALVSSKAVNFEAIGGILSKFGARAAHTGDALGIIVNHRLIDICIPVDFRDFLHGISIERTVGAKE